MNNQTGVEILSSILHHMSYSNIVLSKNDADSPGVIDVKSLHKLLLKVCLENQIIPRSSNLCLVDRELSEEISFYVKTLTNKTLTINLKVTDCAKDVKEEIMYKEGIPFDQQRLIYSGKQLDDGEILHDLGITNGSNLLLCLRLRGGGGILLSAAGLLDERFHFDFTSVVDKKEYNRGGLVYIRPCGWKRYALKVDGKYKDDTWLLGKGRPDPFSSAQEEWPVSYHGTSYNKGLSIAEEGYRLSQCKRFKHGIGIYSTPDIDVAFLYAETWKMDGKTYKVVIQNRVNPKTLVKIDKAETKVGDYWISPNEDEIRPYGFCTREC